MHHICSVCKCLDVFIKVGIKVYYSVCVALGIPHLVDGAKDPNLHSTIWGPPSKYWKTLLQKMKWPNGRLDGNPISPFINAVAMGGGNDVELPH